MKKKLIITADFGTAAILAPEDATGLETAQFIGTSMFYELLLFELLFE